MGAPESGMQAAEQPTAESLLTAFRTIKADERARHEAVLDYWLSIRGDKEFPPLHDLDPLEISEAGPGSILLELIGGGQDAEVRHLGDSLKQEVGVQRIIDAPEPSVLSCIAKKLPIVAISRDFLAFEDSFDHAGGWTRLWVTLLPLSSCGSWVDYVYAFVSIEKNGGKAAKPAEATEALEPEAVAEEAEPVAEVQPEADPVAEQLEAREAPIEEDVAAEAVPFAAEAEAGPAAAEEQPEAEPIPVEEPVEALEEGVAELEAVEQLPEDQPDPADELAEPDAEQADEAPATDSRPGFSKLLEGLANLTGFYGQGVPVEEPTVTVELPAQEPVAAEQPAPEPEPVAPESVEPEPETPVELDEPAAAEPVAELEESTAEPAPQEVAAPEPAPAMEGALQSKLAEVRAKADEARQAALRATAALHEGLSAAYDFALDAETSPEEYLRLVEAEGLKIQLRAPMAPVARLAFNGLADPATIAQCDVILAWALKEELPRGTLLDRINQAGGLAELAGEVKRP